MLALSLSTRVLLAAVELAKPINSTNSTASAQLLTTDEAKSALAKAQEPIVGSGPGTWRYVNIEFNGEGSGTNLCYFTNIFFEWHSSGKHPLHRTEQFDSARTNSRARVWVHNEEGAWALHDNVAILLPPSGTKVSSGLVKNPGGFEWYGNPVKLDQSDPEIAGDVTVTGERFQRDGKPLLLITSRYGEKSRVKLTRMVKKRMPLLFRPFFKAAQLRKLVDEVIPVRYEWVIDPETWSVLVSRAYRADGQLVSETEEWQVWTNLPPRDYVVPKDIVRVRPKSRAQAEQLDSKIAANE